MSGRDGTSLRLLALAREVQGHRRRASTVRTTDVGERSEQAASPTLRRGLEALRDEVKRGIAIAEAMPDEVKEPAEPQMGSDEWWNTPPRNGRPCALVCRFCTRPCKVKNEHDEHGCIVHPLAPASPSGDPAAACFACVDGTCTTHGPSGDPTEPATVCDGSGTALRSMTNARLGWTRPCPGCPACAGSEKR